MIINKKESNNKKKKKVMFIDDIQTITLMLDKQLA